MHSRFSEKWLETVCSLLPDVHSAVFMVPDQDNNQLHLLGEYGVDEIQGYLLSKPANAEALEPMIRNPQQHLGSPANVVQLRP